jgi:carbon storage regulator
MLASRLKPLHPARPERNLSNHKEAVMLVLSRKVGEQLLIGDSIVVTVVRIGPHDVRIGIEAPADVDIVRTELIETADRAGVQSSGWHGDTRRRAAATS